MNVADAASSLSSHHPPRSHQGQSTRFFPVHTSSVIFLSPVCARPILVLAPGTRHAAPPAFWGRFTAAAKSGPIVAGSSQGVKDLDSSLKGACTLRPTDHVSVPHSKRRVVPGLTERWLPIGFRPGSKTPGKSTACALHYTRTWRTSLPVHQARRGLLHTLRDKWWRGFQASGRPQIEVSGVSVIPTTKLPTNNRRVGRVLLHSFTLRIHFGLPDQQKDETHSGSDPLEDVREPAGTMMRVRARSGTRRQRTFSRPYLGVISHPKGGASRSRRPWRAWAAER